MSLDHRLHLQSEEPDLLVEFDLPPGTHATIGASPKSEIALPLTGIPPFLCILGRFLDGRLFLAELDFSVARTVDLPDYLQFGPYQFTLFHPEPVVEAPAESPPTHGITREQIANRIRALFRRQPHAMPVKELPTVTEANPPGPETP